MSSTRGQSFGRSAVKRLFRPIRPFLVEQVEHVVAPEYARAEDVATAVADLHRALADHVDGTMEAIAILGQRINDLEQRLAALGAAGALGEEGAPGRAAPGPAATPGPSPTTTS